MIAEGGFEVAFHGEYREIVPNERIVNTEVFEGAPEGGAALNVVDVHRGDGRTTLELLMQCESRRGPRHDHRVRHGGRHAGAMDLLEESRGRCASPSRRRRPPLVLVGHEVRLAGAAHGAVPVARDVGERRARRDAAVGVALGGVVDEPARLADPQLDGFGAHAGTA